MNIINKLKSKQNKAATSQLQAPAQVPSHSCTSQTQTNPLPTKTTSQIHSQSRFTQKQQLEEDIDEININTYYERKSKQQQMLSKMEKSDTFKEQNIKQKHFTLNVRKQFNIADIYVFQGELVQRDMGKEVSRKKVKLSCGVQVIQFPQSAGKIILKNVIMLNQLQGLFVGEDIIKIAEKKFNKK